MYKTETKGINKIPLNIKPNPNFPLLIFRNCFAEMNENHSCMKFHQPLQYL